MPNWTFNDVKVETTEWEYKDKKEQKEAKRQLDEFVKLSFTKIEEGDERSSNDIPRGKEPERRRIFSFEGVVPMPKSMRITSGTTTERGMAYIDWKENGKAKRVDDILQYAWVKAEIDGRWNQNKKRDRLCELIAKDDNFDDYIKEGRMALENIEKYGVKDWYDWSNRYWGTKWDACNPQIIDDSLDDNEWDEYFIHFSFDTAWCPPYEYLQALTKMFPLIRVTCSVEEESEAFMGNIIGQWGQLVDNTTDINYPERSDD